MRLLGSRNYVCLLCTWINIILGQYLVYADGITLPEWQMNNRFWSGYHIANASTTLYLNLTVSIAIMLYAQGLQSQQHMTSPIINGSQTFYCVIFCNVDFWTLPKLLRVLERPINGFAHNFPLQLIDCRTDTAAMLTQTLGDIIESYEAPNLIKPLSE